MKITLAKNAGFCFGVKRALELVEKARVEHSGEVATLGEVIHNPQVVERLRQAGIRTLESPKELASGTVVISCHGLGPGIKEAAEKAGLEVIDATCPFVARAQKLVAQLAGEGYEIVIFGDRGHREVAGLVGHAGDKARVLQHPDEADALPFMNKLGVVVQTTQEMRRYQELLAKLAGKCRELRAFNTICEATQERQEAALEISREVDLMIVVGGHNSANTRRLAEVCAGAGVAVAHIETAEEILPRWLAGVKTIGITAGASTPQWIIDEVMVRLKSPAKTSPSRARKA
jgi:small subunit ribosomal protein S1